MKSFIVFLAVIVLVRADWSPPSNEEMDQFRDECFKEENVTAEHQESIKNNDFPSENDVRCYTRCLGLKYGIWDDREGYNAERFKQVIESDGDLEVSLEHLERCLRPIPGTDTCGWSYYNLRCLWDNDYIKKKEVSGSA